MIVLWILLALLGLMVLTSFIRVGVYIQFGEQLRIRAKAGPVTVQLLPKPEKKAEKEKKPKREKKRKQKGPEKPKKKKGPGLTFADIRSAVPALFESLHRGLRRTRKRLKIDPMNVSVIFGGDDPGRVSEMYGWAETAMWTFMPRLEQVLFLPDPRIHLDVDFNASTTRAEGEIGLSLLILDGIGIGGSFGIPLFKWYLGLRKTRAARDKAVLPDKKNNQDQDKGE